MPSEPRPATCVLKVRGPPGVAITILDDDFVRHGGGTESVEVRLPEGLYTVRWQAYDLLEERVVRLTPGRNHVALDGQAAPPAGAPPRIGAAFEGLAPSERHWGSEIVVVEVSDDDDSDAAPGLSKEVRLFNADDVAMRSATSEVEGLQAEFSEAEPAEEAFWATRLYRVPPGVYRIRFRAGAGEQVDQTAPAFHGRRTIILLRKATSQTLSWTDDGFEVRSARTVDPRRTVVFSQPLHAPARPSRTGLRITRLLIAALAQGGRGLEANLRKHLEVADADPLWRLYGAALVLAGLPSPHAPIPRARGRKVGEIRAERRKRIRQEAPFVDEMLSSLPNDLADARLCRRWLNRLRGGRPPHLNLASPPLLAVSWDGVAADLAAERERLMGAPSLRGAFSGPVAAGPWLAWTAAAAKAGVVERAPPMDDADSVDPIALSVQRIAPLLAQLAPSGFGSTSQAMFSVATLGLSPAANNVVHAVSTVGIERLQQAEPDALQALETSLREGGRGVIGQLEAAADQLEAASLSGWRLPETSSAEELVSWAKSLGQRPRRQPSPSESPPALARAVIAPDDPHKGRFGGQAARAGFTLSAVFQPLDGDWVNVGLQVNAADVAALRPDDRAVFYLHETIDPPVVGRRFNGSTSALTVRVFGGFTVGVWLPRQAIELELDLATAPGAPPAIRLW